MFGIVVGASLVLYAFIFNRSDWLGGPLIAIPGAINALLGFLVVLGIPVGLVVLLAVQAVGSDSKIPWAGMIGVMFGWIVGLPVAVYIVFYCFSCGY